MLNQVVLTGRLTHNPERNMISDEGKSYVLITLAVSRSYKNEFGEYETDFIKVKLFNHIAESTIEYCQQGDLIGVKGRLENKGDRLELIAEKITFLSCRRD